MIKKVVVLGSRGMLGYAVTEVLSRRGHGVDAVSREQFDIVRDPLAKLDSVLEHADAVVNCAAMLQARIAAAPIEEVLRVNAVFPHDLSRACEARSVPCLHISTDGVFSGARGRYDEMSPLDADDIYGMTKAAGDPGDCMVLRTSIIGEERHASGSFLEWARGQRGKRVNGFANHRWNGLTTVHFAEVIEVILVGGNFAQGVFHLHSPDSVTKCELLRLISYAYELDLSVTPVNAPSACDRTLRSRKPLSSRFCTKSIRQQLAEMRQFFAG